MLDKLTGKDGKRLTSELLRRQPLFGGEAEIIEEAFSLIKLQEFQPGQTFIEQGNDSSELFLILTGKVTIEINGRLVAERISGQHVGEMSLINPALPRSATVRAAEKTVCGVMAEKDFAILGEKHPVLWRFLAIELTERLQERGRFLSPPNETPEVFIGYSSEMANIGSQIQLALSKSKTPMIVTTWTDSFFRASRTTIESLLDNFQNFDFAILIFGPDDIVTSRGKKKQAPRDNVIFELGLAMGALSRDRTFIVYESGLDIKIPSDLLGVTAITYASGAASSLASRIAPVATQIQLEIEQKGSK
ncbi:cyclic nucleotide-binding protein [Adhaeribacter arboris]|uniref:Cyclic nucleotide-binding protein n=1 Tax=Adhaeribacter arboris TaxID=2072846 RepID=A0A2T2YIT1_9BACT|nr:TIR domain-containing protein [Adhaeribacter arboris]PSR55411.1 cyclic nucleotide-binding protein [Adhaeribacter arboris]